jgi:tetratricopeptide (TPR) repeat protein
MVRLRHALTAAFFVMALTAVLAAQGSVVVLSDKPTERQQIETTIVALRDALADRPDDAELNLKLGICYYTIGHYDRAVPALRNAIRSDAELTEAYLYLGNSLDYLERPDDAIAVYRKGLQYEANARLYYELGVVYEKKKMPQEATDAYRRAANLEPDNAFSQAAVARTLYNAGDFARAVPFYERAVALDPSNARTRLYLGYAYAKTGRRPAAITAFKAVLALDPADAYAMKALGDAYVDDRQLPLARTIYAKLVTIDPQLAARLKAKIDSGRH